jgi:hypothetical protein
MRLRTVLCMFKEVMCKKLMKVVIPRMHLALTNQWRESSFVQTDLLSSICPTVRMN